MLEWGEQEAWGRSVSPHCHPLQKHSRHRAMCQVSFREWCSGVHCEHFIAGALPGRVVLLDRGETQCCVG